MIPNKGEFIYRGFKIVKYSETEFIVYGEDDETIAETDTFDGARNFIDAHKRRGGK